MNVPLRTALALLAFAGNSWLCRLALAGGTVDAASFTSLRLASGALFLVLLLRWRGGRLAGQPLSALALWVYAAAFSFAYLGLTTATGALILFATVQLTMTGTGLARGERVSARQAAGMLLALGGLVYLLLPGVAAPPWAQGLLMVAAGIAWGAYSLRGRGSRDPLAGTAGNFVYALVPAAALQLVLLPQLQIDLRGVLAAVASGVLASGAGYAIWYSVLPRLRATTAATVQLCVPVLAALMGVVLLGEAMSPRLWIASVVVLAGVALVTLAPKPAPR